MSIVRRLAGWVAAAWPLLGSIDAGASKANHLVHEVEQLGGARRSREGAGFIAFVELAQAGDSGQRRQAGDRLFPDWPRSVLIASARTRSKG